MFNKAFSARGVAEDGYDAMLKGKLDIVSGLTGSQKVMMSMLPLMSKRMKLRTVRQMQEV